MTLYLDAKIRTEVTVSFNYGIWTIWFKKTFQFPFTPFYNMWIFEKHEEAEHEIRVENNKYTKSIIGFVPPVRSYDEEYFFIDIRNSWRNGVSDDHVDEIISLFNLTGWDRGDTEDVDTLKKLMNGTK